MTDATLNKTIDLDVELSVSIDIDIDLGVVVTGSGNGIEVSGAGSDVVNGVYYNIGDNGGKPQYRTLDESYGISWLPAFSAWTIGELDGYVLYISYDDVATPNLVTTWETINDGAEPTPTVIAVDVAHINIDIDVSINKTIDEDAEMNKELDLETIAELESE
jgi:hypothetical protein